MLHLTIQAAREGVFNEDELSLVQEWRDLAGVVCARGYVGAGTHWIRWPGFASFRIDREGQVDAYPERSIDSARILDLFHRTIEPLALQALGWETLHASAVVMPRGLVGFCGECAAGKSTLAYGLSRGGYRQFADDSLVLHVSSQGLRALELPFSVRLRPQSAAHFDLTPDGQDPRQVAEVPVRDAGRVSTEPLAALFVLSRITAGEPIVDQLTPSAAFRALLPHARCFDAKDPAVRRRVLEHYLALADLVPVYDLRFAAGLDRLPAVLACIERCAGALEAEPA